MNDLDQVVAESVVLLQNPPRPAPTEQTTNKGGDKVLPLVVSGTIAVIGPSADDVAVQACGLCAVQLILLGAYIPWNPIQMDNNLRWYQASHTGQSHSGQCNGL